jgi:hypothetical protein
MAGGPHRTRVSGKQTFVTSNRPQQAPEQSEGVAGDAATVPVPHDESAPGTSEETERWRGPEKGDQPPPPENPSA